MAHNHAFFPDLNHHRHGIKKRSVGVDGDGSVPSVALENFGDIRIPENGRVVDGVRRFLDKFFPVAVYLETERSKRVSWMGIFFPEPRRTSVRSEERRVGKACRCRWT